MGKIKKISEYDLVGGSSNMDIYPITHYRAVFGSDNKNLEDTFNDFLNYLHGTESSMRADEFPYRAIYYDSGNETEDWNSLNNFINDINQIAATKNNGSLRIFLGGVRIDVSNRVLYYGNKTTSQTVTGPIQLNGNRLENSGKSDTTFSRIYTLGKWTPWKNVNFQGPTADGKIYGFKNDNWTPLTFIGAKEGESGEIFNSYTGSNKNIASGIYSHAEGFKTKAQGISSHAEGDSNTAFGAMSHAEGIGNFVSSRGGHVEGSDNRINSADGATGRDSGHAHAEGYHNEIGPYAPQAHIEGSTNFAGSRNAHVEGYNNILENGARNSHVEGENNEVVNGSHVSHTEGGDNTNQGASYCHIEGYNNLVYITATYGHIEGYNNIIKNSYEHASGKYNFSTENSTLFSIGCGTNSYRKNAFEVDADGRVYILGIGGYIGQFSGDAGDSMDLAMYISEMNDSIKANTGNIEQLTIRNKVKIINLDPFLQAFNGDYELYEFLPQIKPNDLNSIFYSGYINFGDLNSRHESCSVDVIFCEDNGPRMNLICHTSEGLYTFVFETEEGFSLVKRFINSESSHVPINYSK